MQLDTESEADLDTLKRLIDTADVLLENFRPGGLEAKGLGYDALAARNPRLIYLSLKGYLPGPYENRTALDEVVQMQSGLAYMTGPPGRTLRAGAPVNDMMGGMFGAIAIMGALRQRDASRARPASAIRPVRERGLPRLHRHAATGADRAGADADAGGQARLGRL